MLSHKYRICRAEALTYPKTFNIIKKLTIADIAQLVERHLAKVNVARSNRVVRFFLNKYNLDLYRTAR